MIKLSIKCLLCLGLSLSIASGAKPDPPMKLDYVTNLLIRWARPPRLSNISEFAAGWLSNVLESSNVEHPDQIPRFLNVIMDYAQSPSRVPESLIEREWLTIDQNRHDLKLLLVELEYLKEIKDPMRCGAQWLEETLGAVDYLYNLTSLIWLADQRDSPPFFDEADLPKNGQALYLYLMSLIQENVRFCLGHVKQLFEEYRKVGSYWENVLDNWILWKIKTRPQKMCGLWCIRGDPSKSSINRALKNVRNMDSLSSRLDGDFLPDRGRVCFEFTKVVDSFISTYILATVIARDELEDPNRDRVEKDPDFRKLLELYRLCSRLLRPSSIASTVSVNGYPRFNRYPPLTDTPMTEVERLGWEDVEARAQDKRHALHILGSGLENLNFGSFRGESSSRLLDVSSSDDTD